MQKFKKKAQIIVGILFVTSPLIVSLGYAALTEGWQELLHCLLVLVAILGILTLMYLGAYLIDSGMRSKDD